MHQIIRKIRTKRTLYILCFMALNYIEFLRATGTGNVWAAAANCTGLVMMVIIFSVLPIREFLRPKYYIYTGLCIAALPPVYVYWTKHIGEFYLGQAETAVLNVWWIGLAVFYLWKQIFINKQLKIYLNVKSGLWFAFTAWTVISVADKWWPLWFLFMFGIFYLVRFSEEDKKALIDGMIHGTILSFFVMQGWTYLFRPYDEVRYKGAYNNCNVMALYYLTVYCMVLLKLHLLYVKKASRGWKLFYFAGAGGLLGLLFMTMCRTAWVTAVAVTFLYGVKVFRQFQEERWGKVLLRGCGLVLCTVILFPVVFWSVRWLPTLHPHPVWHEGEWGPEKVHSWDPADSAKYVEWDEFWGEILGRFYGYLKAADARNPLLLRAQAAPAEDRDIAIYMDDYSWVDNSMIGRLVFYKIYLQHSTWIGNSNKGQFVFPDLYGTKVWHAQNLWVQMTYTFGYPAGVLSVLLSLAVLFSAWRKTGRKKKNYYALIPLLITVTYFMFGLMEMVWNPGQLIFSLVFFVQHPQMAEAD